MSQIAENEVWPLIDELFNDLPVFDKDVFSRPVPPPVFCYDTTCHGTCKLVSGNGIDRYAFICRKCGLAHSQNRDGGGDRRLCNRVKHSPFLVASAASATADLNSTDVSSTLQSLMPKTTVGEGGRQIIYYTCYKYPPDHKEYGKTCFYGFLGDCIHTHYDAWRVAEMKLLAEEEAVLAAGKKRKKKKKKTSIKDCTGVMIATVQNADCSSEISEEEEMLSPKANDMSDPIQEPPEELICPITQTLFEDPCTTQDGFTFERAAIQKWFENHSTSPLTGVAIDKTLVPCVIVRSMCVKWKDTHHGKSVNSTPQSNTHTYL